MLSYKKLFKLNEVDLKELDIDDLLAIFVFLNNLSYDHELVKGNLYDLVVSELIDREVDLTEIDTSDISLKSRVIKDFSESDFRRKYIDLKVDYLSNLDPEKYEKTNKYIKKKFRKEKNVIFL